MTDVCVIGLVVFVLAFQAGRDAMDVIKSDTKNGVIFASHDTFQAFMTQVTKVSHCPRSGGILKGWIR